jgi:hypothetical protein
MSERWKYALRKKEPKFGFAYRLNSQLISKMCNPVDDPMFCNDDTLVNEPELGTCCPTVEDRK